MLTYAICFIQNVQLACFSIVFVMMALNNRGNRSLRWLAYAFLAGCAGGVFQLGEHILPTWTSLTFETLAAPIGYACIHASIVCFVRRGQRTRWVSLFLVLGSIPLYLFWSLPSLHVRSPHVDQIVTLADFTLGIQTALSSWLLLSTVDKETAWPRRVMGAFLAFYSAVEFARVAAFLITGKTPDFVAPWVEAASGIVYVVSCSVLPLAFIWMMNARLYAEMGRQMTTDPLTQVCNRRGLQAAGELELARYFRGGQDFAVVLVDLDHFKRLNDTFGHAAGDTVLHQAASLLRSLLRDSDVLGRLGGEEFVLLLPAATGQGAMTLVERLRLSMEHFSFDLGHHETCITASFGVTFTARRKALTWTLLLSEADQALYAAKRAGRNRCQLHRLESPAEVALTTDEEAWAYSSVHAHTTR